MFLEDLLQYEELTLYQLSNLAHVPYSTLADIKSGKAQIQNCSVKVAKSIADVFGLTINELLDYAEPFEVFRCNTLHSLKYAGEEALLYKILSSRLIDYYYRIHCHSKCLYLLALVDYLCEKCGIERITNYEPLRKLKLASPLISSDLQFLKKRLSEEQFSELMEAAMPEFMKYNIVEDDLYNVV